MTLYRIDPDAQDGGYASHFTIRAAIEWGLLVEAKKCVHGNYVTHIDEDIEIVNECELSLTWCPGAGLEDTE